MGSSFRPGVQGFSNHSKIKSYVYDRDLGRVASVAVGRAFIFLSGLPKKYVNCSSGSEWRNTMARF